MKRLINLVIASCCHKLKTMRSGRVRDGGGAHTMHGRTPNTLKCVGMLVSCMRVVSRPVGVGGMIQQAKRLVSRHAIPCSTSKIHGDRGLTSDCHI